MRGTGSTGGSGTGSQGTGGTDTEAVPAEDSGGEETDGTTTGAGEGSSTGDASSSSSSSSSDGGDNPICGDGIVDDDEACDDGNDDDTDACPSTCEPAECGDGFVWEGEEACDDGNEIDGDGCETTCELSPGAQKVVHGRFQVCALFWNGDVKCWGWGHAAGYGTVADSNNIIGNDETPASMPALDLGGTATDIAAGYSHTCAILESGDAVCWGWNDSGQLGYASAQSYVGDDETPASMGTVDVGPHTVVEIGGGYQHTCAILDDATVKCWGASNYGQLGYGNVETVGDDELPSAVGAVDLGVRAARLAVGYQHTCVLSDAGAVRCWGRAGAHGALGYGNVEHIGDDELPSTAGDVDVGEGFTVAAVEATTQGTCVLSDAGLVKCWGSNSSGALGLGETPVSVPAIGDDELPSSIGTIELGEAAVDLAGYYFGACAVFAEGGLQCWGANNYGQLGYGTTESVGDDEVPSSMGLVDVGDPVGGVWSSPHTFNVCVRTSTSDVRCWGDNSQGKLGLGIFAGALPMLGDDEAPSSQDPVALQ